MALRRLTTLTSVALIGLLATNALAVSILFVGNSFTYGWGSPVRFYRADSVTDLNSQGIGGVPALFKSFADQAGLNYDVYLETQPGVGIDWHIENKLGVIGQRQWDTVVLHGYSTLDPKKPGDPAVLTSSAKEMAEFLHSKNPAVDVHLMATWPRADQTYDPKGAWYGSLSRPWRTTYAQAMTKRPPARRSSRA